MGTLQDSIAFCAIKVQKQDKSKSLFENWINKLLAHIYLHFASRYNSTDGDYLTQALKPSYQMIPINFRCNRKPYSPATNLGGDSAKFSSD